MHNLVLSIILNHFILVPAIIGVVRFRSILKQFYPFLLILWMGAFNETVSLLLIYGNKSNAVNGNIFVLAEYFLILYQFYKWHENKYKIYLVLAFLGSVLWIFDVLILNSITQNNSLFRSCGSLVIVFLSIDQLTKIIIFERGALFRNAMFIICLSFFFYYTCKAFVESFNAFHIGLSHAILWNLWIILYFVNFIANVFYTIAMICIPVKQELTLLS
jgi:hypothetical protein